MKCPVAIHDLSCCGVNLSSFNVANWGVPDLFGFTSGLKKNARNYYLCVYGKLGVTETLLYLKGKI